MNRATKIAAVAVPLALGMASVAAAYGPECIEELNRDYADRGTYSMNNGSLTESSNHPIPQIKYWDVKNLDATVSPDGDKFDVRLRCRRATENNERRRCIVHAGYGTYRSRRYEFDRESQAQRWAEIVNELAVDERAKLVKTTRASVNAELASIVFMSFVEKNLCNPRIKELATGDKFKFDANDVQARPVQHSGVRMTEFSCASGSCITKNNTETVSHLRIVGSREQTERLSALYNVVHEYCD